MKKNLEAEKKESAEAAKVLCGVCFKEIAPKPLCSGHGKGSGKDEDVSSAKGIEEIEEKTSSVGEKSPTKPVKAGESQDEMIDAFDSEKDDLEPRFEPEIIAELISKGALLVDIDRKSMTLTIKLLCKPDVLTEKQREALNKFMESVIKECNEENTLSDNSIRIIRNDDYLHVNTRTLALFDAIINRLANNLVPTPSPKAQENIERKEVAEVQEIFNPSPFNMKPW